MMRKRILGLALIGLAVPFPALALEGGGVEASGSPGLTVTASLNSCGLAGSQIMCQIDAGWNTLEGAESYTMSVTSPDGSVVDVGETSGQGSSVWVPYAGSGSYSISVTAWGTPPGEEDDGTPEVLDRSTSTSETEDDAAAKTPPEPDSEGGREATDPLPTGEEPPVVDEVVPEEPRVEAPVCEEPLVVEPPDPPAPAESSSDGDEAGDEAPEPEVVDTIPADDDCIG